MVREAEQSGVLRPGATIVESSSGNTGIGLALIGALTGHPVIVLAADTTSEVKLAVLRSFNAEVLLTDWTAQRNLRKTPAMLQPGSPPKYPAPGDHSSIGTGGTKVIGADPVGSAYSGGEPGEIIVDGVGKHLG